MTPPDLTNLRAECERAIELDRATEFVPGQRWSEFGDAIRSRDEHSRTHSARASRVLLLLEAAAQELSRNRGLIIFADEAEHVAHFFRPLDEAMAAIAAEFAGEEMK